ncbi:MAG: hypothetical protein AB1412_01920 [Pseudomonadota bacterium]
MKTLLRLFCHLIIAIFKRLLRGLLIVLGVLFVLAVVLRACTAQASSPQPIAQFRAVDAAPASNTSPTPFAP